MWGLFSWAGFAIATIWKWVRLHRVIFVLQMACLNFAFLNSFDRRLFHYFELAAELLHLRLQAGLHNFWSGPLSILRPLFHIFAWNAWCHAFLSNWGNWKLISISNVVRSIRFCSERARIKGVRRKILGVKWRLEGVSGRLCALHRHKECFVTCQFGRTLKHSRLPHSVIEAIASYRLWLWRLKKRLFVIQVNFDLVFHSLLRAQSVLRSKSLDVLLIFFSAQWSLSGFRSMWLIQMVSVVILLCGFLGHCLLQLAFEPRFYFLDQLASLSFLFSSAENFFSIILVFGATFEFHILVHGAKFLPLLGDGPTVSEVFIAMQRVMIVTVRLTAKGLKAKIMKLTYIC